MHKITLIRLCKSVMCISAMVVAVLNCACVKCLSTVNKDARKVGVSGPLTKRSKSGVVVERER